MKKNLKWVVLALMMIIGVFIGAIIGAITLLGVLYPSGEITVTIENQTDEDIEGLMTTFTNNITDIELPPVESGEVYSFNVKTVADDFYEGSMQLIYDSYSETIVGYIGRGYGGKVEVIIESIDEDNQLNARITHTVK
ncbi:hypothetical protein AJ85_19585 [Alkalihalobacillus alcalophilus ATCC 27647 = CGMCC 1.3604]|uniref:Uncharacterized protein n=1 Tax=Alkalihalobacillus alcalophilus ATCC 27647 = CGMCC 1.3604 TaxID=1218173 RepID=A0A094WGM9_ALKAL|nr:hypothetical protein [Alkalihalobacillus alcalophilus]KGA95941.1 hypothetical protein BALCAV_0219200 [Alkalihalobacillus alcalophilus ATCC 27647 = CGMCC 1.3604]MED1561759.1 hypothetical protein [Alkalihalobacillus alcalophilus]THG89083.1 hypothetical protein AJ85_19585 [Alkalihalobacillus alcalophilus ATCC 27647 = CGMCC 1.3604]